MPPTPTTIRVNLERRSYDLQIGTENLNDISQFVADRCQLSHAVVITDENVVDLYGQRVALAIEQSGARADLSTVAAGELSKSITEAERLWHALLDAGADRASVVIAVGGGVVGDLAGFVAATFARGLAFVQVPTTLLAQVDSSVGGKVAINLPGAKNMVGAFWQPRGVLIDIQTLVTLPEREYRAGLAEVVKYGVILDADFFAYLEQNIAAINDRDANILQHVVARCCRLKADVVEADEREESGLRSVLNYGHTFCHALEAVSGYDQLLHGEAVSIGMLCASRLAERLNRVDQELTRRQRALLQAFGLPTALPDLDLHELLGAMQRDKKMQHGKLRFVLPTRMGHVELVGDVDPELARGAMEDTG
ncbi:MAG: 3-dehydroquinate synthase [Planctomycetes bacterium]|nr:3-dehydroquinate synthase [Planctomycetota bacterium]